MPVTVEVPTGAEMHEHYRRWEALPEGERPQMPFERWVGMGGWEWLGGTRDVGVFPDDDTPQPGLRLVPLPTPVGDGWRRPVDEAEARAAGRWGDGVMEVMSDTGAVWSSGVVGNAWGDVSYRVPASWEPGRERVEVGQSRGRTIGGLPIVLTWSQTGVVPLKVQLEHGTQILATVIGGTAWVWVDPIEAPEPEPWVPQVGDLVRCVLYKRRPLPKRVVHVHEGQAWIDEEGAEWWHQVVPLSSLRPWTEQDGD